MIFYERKFDIRYLIPFLRVGKVLGLSPHYDARKLAFSAGFRQKCNAFVLLIILTMAYLLFLSNRLRLYHWLPILSNAMDIYSCLTAILVNATVVLSVNFWNAEKYSDFLNGFLEVDRTLRKYAPRPKGWNSFYFLEMVITQTIVLAASTCSVISLASPMAYLFRHYLIEHTQRYHIFFMVTLLYNLLLSIKYRFQSLNANMRDLFDRTNEKKFSNGRAKFFNWRKSSEALEEMTGLHMALCSQVDAFNKVFGWTVFFLTLHIISSYLFFLYMIVTMRGMMFVMNLRNVMLFCWTGLEMTLFFYRAHLAETFSGGAMFFRKIFCAHTRQTDIRYLVPLLHVASFMALAPAYDSQRQRFLATSCQKMYTICVVLGLASSYVLFWPMRMHKYKVGPPLVNALEIYASFSMIFVNITSLGSTSFWNAQKYVKFLNKFAELDRTINKYGQRQKGTNLVYYAEIMLTQTLAFWIFFKSCHDLFTQDADFRHYITEQVQRFHVSFMVLMLYNLMLSVKNRYKSVRIILKDHVLKKSRRHWENEDLRECVESLTAVYMSVCEQVQLFNDIFGWVIFFMTLNTISSNLFFLYLMVIFKYIKPGLDFLCQIILWAASVLLMGIMIAAASDMAHREAQETGNICYTLLHELNRVPKTSQVLLLQESLQRLGKQASICCPYFSAGPFLRIDYTWLFVIMQLTTSYFVVILQFKT